MKKILLALTAISLLAFTGCSKDDDEGGGPLVGKWVEYKASCTNTGDYTIDAEDAEIIQFLGNGTYNAYEGSLLYEQGRYTYNETTGVLKMISTRYLDEDTGRWENDELDPNDPDDWYVMLVESLAGNEMVIVVDGWDEETGFVGHACTDRGYYRRQ